jgi:putative cell wall-binding protein
VTVTGTSIVASSAPNILPSGTNQTAGNLVVTLAAGYTTTAADSFTITVKDSAAASTITWDHNPTLTVVTGSGDNDLCAGGVSSGCTVTGANTGVTNGFMLTVNLTGPGQTVVAPATSTITLSNIGYTSGTKNPTATAAAAGGPVQITTSLSPATAGLSASNAVVSTTAIATLFADTTPTINPGASATAGTWEVYLSGANNSWTSGDKIYITIARNDGTNCETLNVPDSVGFSAAPTVLVSVAQNGATTTPTLTASLAEATGSSCSTSGIDNELVLTFTNSGTISTGTLATPPGNGAAVDITLYQPKIVASADTYTGLTYTTNPANPTGTNLGPIDVAYGYNTAPTFTSSMRIISLPTPAGVVNDELLGGSELGAPGAGTAQQAADSGTCTPLGGAAGTGFNTIHVFGPPSTILGGSSLEIGPTSPSGPSQVVTVTGGPYALGAGPTAISVVCFAPTGGVTGLGAIGVPVSGPSDANINPSALTVTANSPSTTLQYNTTSSGGESVNNPISPIKITEGAAGALGGGVDGYACISLTQSAMAGIVEWNSASTPTAAASGGGLAVGSVNLLTPGGQSGPTILEFQVTTASSGTPGTVTISGLNVNVPEVPGLTLTASLVYQSNGPSCTTGADIHYAGNPFILAYVAGRTWGSVADATAAQEFGFDVNGGTGDCLTDAAMGQTAASPNPLKSTNAVLVTNTDPYDALSAAYLAGGVLNTSSDLRGTGVLLTPTNSVDPLTLAALRQYGVTDVYVVGGPLVVSQADITTLQSTPIYNCDGSVHTGLTGAVNLTVHWIYGPDADGTAEEVGTYFGPGHVGTADFPGAYAGQYNDTSGSNGSGTASAPDSPVSTAFVVTDGNFPDASVGSVAAAYQSFPMLLTGTNSLAAETQAALENDSIQQVIVLGGPLAVSDNVVSQIEALGITVVRIAGADFTDSGQMLAQFELASVNLSGTTDGLGWNPTYITVARGDNWSDAITAGPYSAFLSSGPQPVLLTLDPNNVGTYLPPFLKQIGQVGYNEAGRKVTVTGAFITINNALFIGGPLAISQTLENTVLTDLNG